LPSRASSRSTASTERHTSPGDLHKPRLQAGRQQLFLLARRLDRVNMQDTTKGGVDFLLADPPRGSVARLLSLKHSIK
jgi:hypothetical protein